MSALAAPFGILAIPGLSAVLRSRIACCCALLCCSLRSTHRTAPPPPPTHTTTCGAEDVFDDKFWDGLEVVVNALDNVNARCGGPAVCGGAWGWARGRVPPPPSPVAPLPAGQPDSDA